MSWRIEVDHTTTYTYPNPISSQHNELRITPRDTTRQLTIEHTLEIDPVTNIYRYKDYFGTRVASFAIEEAHEHLKVTGKSLVETAAGASNPSKAPITWETIRSSSVADKFCEYLTHTNFADKSDSYSEIIETILKSETPGLAVQALSHWIRTSIAYVPGSTQVGTKASHVIESKSGVCQDFVHLALAILRSCSIPCRYVSGYLYPVDHGEIGENVIGESHAWCEAWLGDWYGIDPTNDLAVAEKHVLVGWGRDYQDVAPVKGILNGDPRSTMYVNVNLRRVA